MSLKVVIVNKTKWQTKLLRPFVVRIAREEFSGTKPSNTRRKVTIEIGYNRGKGQGYCSGWARYHSSYAAVNVPNPAHGKPFPVLDFCHVVGHEFGHCKGIKHADMGLHYGNSCARGGYSGPHYDWAKALPVPVPVAPKRAPSTDEKRTKALAAALEAVERWTRKKKLSETKLKLWTRKVRTLEKRLAVAACGTKPANSSSNLVEGQDGSTTHEGQN